MALFDMIKESMTPKRDSMMEALRFANNQHKREQAMESARANTMRQIQTEKRNAETVAMSPAQFLAAVETEMYVKGTQHPNLATRPMTAQEALHFALEETLPDEEPPIPIYDTEQDLDDIEQAVAGIDAAFDNPDPDQPDPQEDINNDTTINDFMTAPQDIEELP